MLILPSLFDIFDNLDQISPEAITTWLKPVPDLNYLENYLANKVLYPEALPQTEYDMQIDLSILREAIKINGPKGTPKINALLGDNPFLNITLRKILIPSKFLNFVPDLKVLVICFIDALLPDRKKSDFFQDLWTIVLTDGAEEVVGSVLLPQFEAGSGSMRLNLQNKAYEIRPRNLTIIPCPSDRCEIAYKLQGGKLLGKADSAVEVYGGKLGLIIDVRNA